MLWYPVTADTDLPSLAFTNTQLTALSTWPRRLCSSSCSLPLFLHEVLIPYHALMWSRCGLRPGLPAVARTTDNRQDNQHHQRLGQWSCGIERFDQNVRVPWYSVCEAASGR